MDRSFRPLPVFCLLQGRTSCGAGLVPVKGDRGPWEDSTKYQWLLGKSCSVCGSSTLRDTTGGLAGRTGLIGCRRVSTALRDLGEGRQSLAHSLSTQVSQRPWAAMGEPQDEPAVGSPWRDSVWWAGVIQLGILQDGLSCDGLLDGSCHLFALLGAVSMERAAW